MEEYLLSCVWPEWNIVELIGSGAYGSVYKAVRKDYSLKTFSAIKIISVPQNKSEITELSAEGYDKDAIKEYYRKLTSQLVNEVELLVTLKDATNIVKIYDYKVVDNEDIGCNIFIRMELLTPFNRYILDNGMSQSQIIKLGIDICNALEICNKHRIVHRDIKPDNILVSQEGEFKLGDFGIAKRLDNSTDTINHRGIVQYMAPEVLEGKKYDERADIYSLGIILYKLLNNKADNIESITKMPMPINAENKLTKIIVRACEYTADKRFQNATEFKNELSTLCNTEMNLATAVTTVDNSEQTLVANQQMFIEREHNVNKKLIIIVIILFAITCIVVIVVAMSNNILLGKKQEVATNEIITEEATTEEVTIEEITTEEVTTEEVTTEEVTTEEVTTEEVTTEEVTTEEVTTEEVTTEEVTTEEVTTEEVTTEEVTTEEITTEETVMENIYIVPNGCTYYDASTDKVYSEGSEINIKAEKGDELRTRDYIYIYDIDNDTHSNFSSFTDLWCVTVKDKSKTSYEDILDTIAGENVENMHCTFELCVNLKIAPNIPENVKDLCKTFKNCESLEVAPKLPNGAKLMDETFYNCMSLKEFPEIPQSVYILDHTFSNCISLKKIPAISDNVIDMTGAFDGCYAITEVESLPSKVEKLGSTFWGCKSLVKIPIIPESVLEMRLCFMDCSSLTGEIIINANPTSYDGCFWGVGDITLKGSSKLLEELNATKLQ